LLIGRGIVLDRSGWTFVFLLFACPVLAVAMLIVLGLTLARKSVRSHRMVSWLDVGLLGAWYLAILATGLVAQPVMAVLVVALAAATFWAAIWQLYTETRRRVQTAFASFTAIPAGEYAASRRAEDGSWHSGPTVRIESGKR
jgi:hypothetical protein